MANRAYLFSTNLKHPEAWKRPEQEYFDSRWVIPLAWFFFFTVSDIKLIPVQTERTKWKEVKLVAPRQNAVHLFESRQPYLETLIAGQVEWDCIIDFLATIQNWEGTYLGLDPEEVFAGLAETDAWHARRFAQIIKNIRLKKPLGEEVKQVLMTYTWLEEDQPENNIGKVVGYTYW